MRLIGTLGNENSARRITSYLKEKGIDSNCEMAFDANTGQMSYQLWILDEDKIQAASAAFLRFQKEPRSAEFDAPVRLRMEEEDPPIQEGREEPAAAEGKRTPLTLGILTLCFLVFIYNAFQELPMRQEGLESVFLMTPIQASLLYDIPPAIDALEEMLERHPVVPGQKVENLAPEVEARLQEIEKMPMWRGIYDWFILKIKGQETTPAEGPLFLKIRQGEAWRLFSPCVLHSEFLHILFNMIWLWVLGRPIEQRIGFAKTGILTLIAGIGSNTIQYLVSGPFFIGYSGVVMALAGFIWMRERLAPWEGYPLNRTTILFLVLFVVSMFALTFASFFLQIFTSVAFAPNIANTAHIAGAVIGALLGRLSFFARNGMRAQ
jgi:rhomboid protease GlpG